MQYDFIEGEAETVNTILRNDQQTPAVTVLPNGKTLVVWSSDDLHPEVSPTEEYIPGGLKAQLYDLSGSKVGAEFQLTNVGGAGRIIGQ